MDKGRINDILKVYPYNFSLFLSTHFVHPSRTQKEWYAEEALMINPIELDNLINNSGLLTDRDKLVVRLYFVDGFTFDKIGEKIGVGKDRVRQILQRIRRNILYRGHFEKRFRTITLEKADLRAEDNIKQSKTQLEPWPTRTSDLSIRSFNCLYRVGIKDFRDLVGKTKKDILQIRCCGEKTCDEIINYMLSHYPVTINEETGKILYTF